MGLVHAACPSARQKVCRYLFSRRLALAARLQTDVCSGRDVGAAVLATRAYTLPKLTKWALRNRDRRDHPTRPHEMVHRNAGFPFISLASSRQSCPQERTPMRQHKFELRSPRLMRERGFSSRLSHSWVVWCCGTAAHKPATRDRAAGRGKCPQECLLLARLQVSRRGTGLTQTALRLVRTNFLPATMR